MSGVECESCVECEYESSVACEVRRVGWLVEASWVHLLSSGDTFFSSVRSHPRLVPFSFQ